MNDIPLKLRLSVHAHIWVPLMVDRLHQGRKVMLINFCKVVLKTNYVNFLNSYRDIVIPCVLQKRDSSLLNTIASIFEAESVSSLILENIHFVYVQVFKQRVSDKHTILDEAKRYLNDTFKHLPDVSLIQSCATGLIIKLFVDFQYFEDHDHFKSILRYIGSIVLEKEEEAVKLNEVLKPYQLAIMYHLNDIASSSPLVTHEKTKLAALSSLEMIIKIIGMDVGSIAPQVIATLVSIMRCGLSSLLPKTLEIWKSLISHFNGNDFQTMIIAIVSILLDEYNFGSETTSSKLSIKKFVFEIIHDYRGKLEKAKLKELEVITAVYQQKSLKFGNDTIRVIDTVNGLLSYSDSSVVKQTLNFILTYLKSSNELLINMVSNDSIDLVVSVFINNLLSISQKFSSSSEIQMLSIECLGYLGAVDPDKLQNSRRSKNTQALKRMFLVDTNEDAANLSLYILVHLLIPTFKTCKDTKLQDKYAFTIQEMLKLCGFNDNLPNGRATESMSEYLISTSSVDKNVVSRWNMLPIYSYSLVHPLLKSRYVMSIPKQSRMVFPLYPQCTDYGNWITTFTSQLLSSLPDELLAKKVLGKCHGIILSDCNASWFLLPYVVLHCLTELIGYDQIIFDEILSIFESLSDVTNDSNIVSSQANPKAFVYSKGYSEYHHKATQTIYDLLEQLKGYSITRKIELYNIKSKAMRTRTYTKDMEEKLSRQNSQVNAMQTFVESMRFDLLSNGASVYGNHARSLFYYEMLMRSSMKNSNALENRCMQERYLNLYSQMDEPDGVQGIKNYFNLNSLHSNIILYEMTGNWTLAQSCYETILKSEPEKLDYHIGLIRSLKSLGHLESMVAHIQGLKARQNNSEWEKELNNLLVEASWRLSDWDSLEKHLEEKHVESSFEVSISKILLSIYQKNSSDQFLIEALGSLIPKFTVMSNVDSHSNLYEPILHCHMLTDVKIMLDYRSKKMNLETLCKLWSDRLSLIRSSYRLIDPILNLHRVLLQLLKLDPEIDEKMVDKKCGSLWLLSSKNARKFGHLHVSHSCILQAEVLFGGQTVVLEKAKWMWKSGQHTNAINSLLKTIPSIPDKSVKSTQQMHEFWEESRGTGFNKLEETMQVKVNSKIKY
jgi:serine/threonine-protein kinase ATR